MKFLIVYHCWFVDSKGFDYEEVIVNDKNHAQDIASARAYKRSGTFNRCAYQIIELKKEETTRELSWMERLTGRIKRSQ